MLYAFSTKGKKFKAIANEIIVFYGAQALMGIIRYFLCTAREVSLWMSYLL